MKLSNELSRNCKALEMKFCMIGLYTKGILKQMNITNLLDLCGKDLTDQEPLESVNIRIIEDIPESYR